MWKAFSQNSGQFMIKFEENDHFVAYLTDLQTIWVQEILKESLPDLFQKHNPMLDVKVEDVAKEVSLLVDQVPTCENLELSINEEDVELTIISTKTEVKIQFQFSFLKATQDMFFKHVTVPLVQTVKHLEDCRNVLSTLVQKKDRELEEYRLEKGPISREDLITEKFDENTLGSIDDKSMMNVFGRSAAFWDSFSQRYGKIDTKLEGVQKDPWNHIKRKRKIYSSKIAVKRGKGIDYTKN